MSTTKKPSTTTTKKVTKVATKPIEQPTTTTTEPITVKKTATKKVTTKPSAPPVQEPSTTTTKKTTKTTTPTTAPTTTTTKKATKTITPVEQPTTTKTKTVPTTTTNTTKKPAAATKKSKQQAKQEEIKASKPSICFYEELGIAKSATESEIKKAYYKKAREVHPDKNNSPEAKEEFQKLGRIYSILKEPTSRKFYDKHGDVEGSELGGLKGEDLYNAWMEQYNIVRVSEEKLKEYFKLQDLQKKSSGKQISKDEEDDLIDYYNRHRGDMEEIKEYVIGVETKEDVIRMCDHLRHLIAKKRVKSYPSFFTSATFSNSKSNSVDQADSNNNKEDEELVDVDDILEEEEEEKVAAPKKKTITKKVAKTPILKKKTIPTIKNPVAALKKRSAIKK